MRRLLFFPLALTSLPALLSLWGCGEEETRYVANAGNQTPTMATEVVSTFISDSGYTRYHLETPLWLIYEDTAEPFWRFPDGIELEQYDDYKRVESTVVCDSAIYWSRKRLWRLDGNVVMVSTAGDSFLTEQLFWEQETKRIRSDSFIHIVKEDRVLEGYGFESDQSMADYLIHRPTAIIPAERPGAGGQKTAPADSDTTSATQARERRSPGVRPSQRVEMERSAQPKKTQRHQAGGLRLSEQSEKHAR